MRWSPAFAFCRARSRRRLVAVAVTACLDMALGGHHFWTSLFSSAGGATIVSSQLPPQQRSLSPCTSPGCIVFRVFEHDVDPRPRYAARRARPRRLIARRNWWCVLYPPPFFLLLHFFPFFCYCPFFCGKFHLPLFWGVGMGIEAQEGCIASCFLRHRAE